ncbi:hypothetical protein RU08_24635 [Pseudomonas fulva]|uniref:Uncharacterized protein n=1 Tax=Pseudomonas fulva TaxID=47880 RepID=A0A0D0JUS9_9PSED|nr:hypothetical protein RU08_24635 [Pseudomonas fulva]
MGIFPLRQIVIESVGLAKFPTCRAEIQIMVIQLINYDTLSAARSGMSIEMLEALLSCIRDGRPSLDKCRGATIIQIRLCSHLPLRLDVGEVTGVGSTLPFINHIIYKCYATMLGS